MIAIASNWETRGRNEKRPCRRSLGRRCHLCGASASTASRTTIDHGPGDRPDRRLSEGHAPKGSFLHASISEMRARSPADAWFANPHIRGVGRPWSAPASGGRAAGNRLGSDSSLRSLPHARKWSLRRHLPTRHESPETCWRWRIRWAGTRVGESPRRFPATLGARRALRPPAPTTGRPPPARRRRLVIAIASN